MNFVFIFRLELGQNLYICKVSSIFFTIIDWFSNEVFENLWFFNENFGNL